jgi:hypothetical protein
MGYQGIGIDLESGKGPYLRTLLDLLRTPAGEESPTSDRLRNLFKTYPNIMDFADHVIPLISMSVETSTGPARVLIPPGPGVYSGDDVVNALEHLTRGMAITVTLKTGEQLKGTFSEYSSKRLWIRGATRKSVLLEAILAIEAPRL